MRARRVLAATFLAFALAPLSAHAAPLTRLCVPSLAVKTGCQAAFASIQAAIDAAAPSAVVYLGAGAYAERISMSGKAVRLMGVPDGGGALPILHDDGLPFAEAHVAIEGARRPELWNLDLRATNAATIVAVRGSANALVKGNRFSGTAAIGLHVQSPAADEGENFGFAVLSNEFTGVGTAVKIEDATAIAAEKNLITAVGVGVEAIRVQIGQLFWNTFEDAGIAIRVRNANHTDVNSNRVVRSAVGFSVEQYAPLGYPDHRRATANDLMEYNHNRFLETAVPIQVQLAFPDDGRWSTDPGDDPGSGVQWVDNAVDGVLLPSVKTPSINFKKLGL